MDLEQVISNAVAEAKGSAVDDPGDRPDTGNVIEDTPDPADDVPTEDQPDDSADQPSDEDNPDDQPVEDLKKSTEKADSGPKTEKKDEKKVDEDDDFSKIPKTFVDKRGRTVENRIPHSRVEKMIAKRVSTEVAERDAKITDYEGRLSTLDRLGEIAEKDADRFIQILAAQSPDKYGKFLAVIEGGKGKTKAAEASVDADDPEPEPDVTLADGSRTYSMAGLAKLREYDRRQAAKAVLAEVDKKYGGIKTSHDAAQTRAQYQAQIDAMVRHAVDNWPGFKEHAKEIFGLLNADKTGRLSLDDAYRSVVIPKYQEQAKVDREKLRAEILAEIKAAPTSTATTTTTTTPPPDTTKPRNMEDIIRDAIRPLKKGRAV